MALSEEMLAFQAEFQAAERENQGFLFPWSLTFALGSSSWPVRCEVVQPNPRDQQAYQLALSAAATQDVAYQDIRLLYVSPDSTRPAPGAQVAWEGGTLEILEWSDLDPLSGSKTGTAVMRR